MRLSDVVRAGLATLFALLVIHPGQNSLLMYLAAGLITVFDVVFSTALRASVPLLVQGSDPESKRRLTAVNSMLVTQTTVAQLVAPPVFVFALHYISPATVVLLNAATFLFSYVLLRRFASAVSSRTRWSGLPEQPAEHDYLESLRRGFSIVRRDDVAWRLLVAYAVTGGIGFALLLSVPQVVEDRHLSPLTVGISFSVLAGASLLGARLAKRDYLAKRPVRILVLDPLIRAAVVAFLAMAANEITFVVGFLIIGTCAGLANVSRITVFQLRFDDTVMARVMSSYFLASQIFTPVTPLLWATLAAVYGFTASYLIVAAIFVCSSLLLVAGRATRRELSRS
jgi:hypothetical protein